MTKKQKKYPFVDLTNDRAFKAFFSNKKKLLFSLLKAFLPLPDKKSIQSIEFMTEEQREQKLFNRKQNEQKITEERSDIILTDPSLYAPSPREKQVVLDLNVRLNTGEKVDVEMQASDQTAFIERAIFYWARLFTKGLEKADDYKQLSPTYSVIFTKFPVLGEHKRDFKSSFSIRSDDPSHFKLSEYLRMLFVELSLFQPQGDDINKLLDEQSQWCYLIRESGRLTPEKAELLARKGGDMAEALKFLYELSADHRRQAEQEAVERYERDQRGIKQFEYEKGLKKGMEKGRVEGRQEGRQEGRTEGMQAVALKMLKKSADVAFISEVTSLSEEEIKKLKNGSC